MSDNRPDVPDDVYNKPVPKGGNLPPLPLLPDRTWLFAKIIGVELRYAMFNGAIQYVTRKEFDKEQDKEIDVDVIDEDTGEKIPRYEFNIKFQLHEYELPNDKGPRCCWLKIGAAQGDKAHLPTLLFNVVGPNCDPDSYSDVITMLRGKEVRLQLSNKPNKDETKQPWQNVIYDAVENIKKPAASDPVKEPVAWDE